MKELVLKQCKKCHTIVKVLEGENEITCCGEVMEEAKANSVDRENREVILKPGDAPEMTVPYEKGALIYAYCNKHGLWKTVVE